VPSDVTASFFGASDESGPFPRWEFRAPFTLGGHPIRAASVSCTSSDGLSAAGSFGTGGPGEHSIVVTFASQPPAGDHVLNCTLTVTTPSVLRVESTGGPITVHVAL